MTRTKLAFVGFVAARNCMRQQVLDDAKSLPNCGRSQSATACDSSYAPHSAQYYSVLQSTTPVLLCTTKFYSSTTVCYKVLLQYYCATKYYSSTALYCSSTTLYYSTTPVLQGTTTLFYKNTTPVLLYYKVPFQYYSVLQSAFPYYKVLLQHYSVLQSITLYYKVLLRTEESYMKWH